jgi:putative transposase
MALYHVWFSTKRRKWLLQGDISVAVKEIMNEVALERRIGLRECEAIVDHVHLLLDVEDRPALKAMNFLKGTTAQRIFQRFPELKLDGGVNNLWQHRYAFKEIPEAAASTVATYIRTQWDRLEDYERYRSPSLPGWGTPTLRTMTPEGRGRGCCATPAWKAGA